MTDNEVRIKKEKGLCFRCDEKFSLGHRCKRRELNIIAVQEGEDLSDKTDQVGEEIETNGNKEVNTKIVNLSINSLVGFNSPKTIKIKGEIRGREVVVLIDGGATHNFIAEEVVKELKISVETMDAYGVVLGTGGVVQATSVCKDVNLTIANLSITHDFLPLPLGSADVILGVTWLEMLGKVVFYYKLSEMEFSLGEWVVILQGDRSLVRSQVSLKSIMKTFEKEDQGVSIELSAVVQWGVGEAREHIADYLSKLQPEIQKVLQSFSVVFEPSNQLPPPRDHDHAIELEPGARAVNVRPYRYPQF